MLSVFFIFVFFVSGPVSFVFFLSFFSSKGRFLKKFSGANFCFWVVGLALVFFGGFLLMFLLYFLAFRSRNCLEKFSSCQVWFFFWVRSLFLRFFFCRRRRFRFLFLFFLFSRDIDQVVTGHPLHTHLFFWFFFFFVSRRVCLFRPFWPCVPLLGVFSGCHSGPRAVLGFSLN